jgi:hypothetical protein
VWPVRWALIRWPFRIELISILILCRSGTRNRWSARSVAAQRRLGIAGRAAGADFDFDFVQIGDTKLLARSFCSLSLIKDAGVSLGVPIALFDLSLQINDSSNTLLRLICSLSSDAFLSIRKGAMSKLLISDTNITLVR